MESDDMLSIDEALVNEKRRAENCKGHYDKFVQMEAEEHEQLAEWLEELKSYRVSVFSGDMTQAMLKEEYCKAVDDFAEKLNAKCDGMIKEKWNSNVTPISWAEAYADFKDDIDEIKEELKAGEKNEQR